jgi:hypothetical protein
MRFWANPLRRAQGKSRIVARESVRLPLFALDDDIKQVAFCGD